MERVKDRKTCRVFKSTSTNDRLEQVSRTVITYRQLQFVLYTEMINEGNYIWVAQWRQLYVSCHSSEQICDML